MLYEFTSDKPKKLDIDVGDIIEVSEWGDNWSQAAHFDGRNGSFPTKFALPMDDVELVVALFDFDARKDHQLSFSESTSLEAHLNVVVWLCMLL